MFKKLLGFTKDPNLQRSEIYRELIQKEAKLGGTLFGPVAKGGRREFFCLDEHTWVWHEEWNAGGTHQSLTTRYDIRPQGVYKAQDNQSYQPISLEEAQRFYNAIMRYQQEVDREYAAMLAV